jgi:hypothetical protein
MLNIVSFKTSSDRRSTGSGEITLFDSEVLTSTPPSMFGNWEPVNKLYFDINHSLFTTPMLIIPGFLHSYEGIYLPSHQLNTA